MSTGQRKTKALVGVVGAMGALAAGATITANADSIQVKQGDTVWELSQKLGVSIDDLEAQNSIDSKTDLIFVGQKLQVRSAKTTQTYTVKSGDTLWDLAQQYHVSVAQLQKANSMTGDVLSVGQKLTIPRGSTVAKATTPTTGTTSSATRQSTQKANAVQAQIVAQQQAAATQQQQKQRAAATSSQSSSTTQQSAATTSTSQSSSSAATSSVTKQHTNAMTRSSRADVASSAATSSVSSSSTTSSSANTTSNATRSTSSSTTSASQTTQPQRRTRSAVSSSASAQSSTSQSSVAQSSSQSVAQSAPSATTTSSQSSQAQTGSQNATATTRTKRIKTTTQSAVKKQAAKTNSSSSTSSSSSATVATSSSTKKTTSTAGLTSGSVTGLALKLASANIPYVWGGSSLSGMDCSGLVAYVYKNAMGVSLPHNTVAQEAYVSTHSVGSAKPGDILFWGSKGATYHDAIYLGNNQFVDAPTPGQNVQVHQISKYFMPSFAGTVK